MFVFYVIATVVFYFTGAVVACMAFVNIKDGYGDKAHEWRVYRAAVGVGLATLWLWPIALTLALPIFILWGLRDALRLLKEHRSNGVDEEESFV